MQTFATSNIPTTERPESRVAGHIRDASDATGVPFEFLLAQANQESRLNPDAKNRNSSATGLYQFTSGTWMDMVKRHGAEHGLEKYAQAISRGADGRWTVKNKEMRKEILDLRKDPRLSALMAGEYAKDNAQVLEARLGRKATDQDLYLAHFLGAGGAIKMIKSRHLDGTGDSPELASAASANPDVFHDQNSGERKSLDVVYDNLQRRFRHAMSEASRLSKTLRPQVDLAELRPPEKPLEKPVEAPDAQAATLADLQKAPRAEDLARMDLPNFARRASLAALDDEPTLERYPVPLPPPILGAKADSATLRSLFQAVENKDRDS